jgi:hypothetical protein
MKKFHITDILSILNENIPSTRKMEGTTEILNYMGSQELNNFQLRYAAFKSKKSLLLQFDFLKDAVLLDGDKIIQQEWIDNKVKEYGDYFEVKPLHTGIIGVVKKLMFKLDKVTCDFLLLLYFVSTNRIPKYILIEYDIIFNSCCKV